MSSFTSFNQRNRNRNGNRGRGGDRSRGQASNAGGNNTNVHDEANNTGRTAMTTLNSARHGQSSGNARRGGRVTTGRNDNDGAYSSNANMLRRQTLREGSTQDVSSARGEYGAIGSGPSRPSTATAAAITTAAAAQSTAAMNAILDAGALTVCITVERELSSTSSSTPSFLRSFVPASNPHAWNQVILPHIRTFTFRLSNNADCHYFTNMLASSQLPSLFQAVTKIDFDAFYWFSGISHNRRASPYFELTRALPALEEVTFRMHTAGITTSCYGERQMIALEATHPERAKARKTMSVDDVVRKYDLDAIFACRRIKKVKIEYIDCERTRYFTRVFEPVDLLGEVQRHIYDGFFHRGLNVFVQLVKVG